MKQLIRERFYTYLIRMCSLHQLNVNDYLECKPLSARHTLQERMYIELFACIILDIIAGYYEERDVELCLISYFGTLDSYGFSNKEIIQSILYLLEDPNDNFAKSELARQFIAEFRECKTTRQMKNHMKTLFTYDYL